MFENPEIALDDLPNADALDWQPIERRYIKRMLVERSLIVLAMFVVTLVPYWLAGYLFSPTIPPWVLVMLFAIPFLAWPYLSVPRRGYVVRDRDIVFKSGVLWRSVTAVPFNRIQHVETSHTPLDRYFDVATLQLFTAGGSGGDLAIAGLDTDVAERLRAHLLDKVGASIENA